MSGAIHRNRNAHRCLAQWLVRRDKPSPPHNNCVEPFQQSVDIATIAQRVAYEEAMSTVCGRLAAEIGKEAAHLFVLHRVHGFTQEEIGELMGKSPGTIEKMLATALLGITEKWLGELAHPSTGKK